MCSGFLGREGNVHDSIQEVAQMKSLLTTILFICALPALGIGAAVTYEAEGKKFEGHFKEGKKGAPLLILVHDWDGLTDYEVKRTEMLSELGYHVFAVDLYGKGVRPTETAEKKKLSGALYGDREKMRTLLMAAAEHAQKLSGADKDVVVLGYCFGGSAALELARSGMQADAFVSFHGGLGTPDNQDYSSTKGKVMVFHGTADKVVSMEDFADLADELEEANIPHEMITYSGAPHAFTVFGSDRYREEADKQSWSRFLNFLNETYN